MVRRSSHLAEHHAKRLIDQQVVRQMVTHHRWPSWRQWRQLPRFLSTTEKRVVAVAGGLAIIALGFWVVNGYFFWLQPVPQSGGEYSEGFVGAPKLLNPVLAAANDVDADITPLLFCSLFQRQGTEVVPDIVNRYEVTADGKQYTVVLKPDIRWHDGEALTVDDILFTFDLIRDTDVGSPLFKAFSGVSAQAVDDRTVQFTLAKPFAPFLSTLTFGILPERHWGMVQPAALKLAELNLKPIGCGPFRFQSLKKDKQGNIRSLTLVAFDQYHAGRPYFDTVVAKFYPDTQSAVAAVVNKNVMALGGVSAVNRPELTELTSRGWSYHLLTVPQYTAIFFNQSRSGALTELPVRQALYRALDRQRLAQKVLAGDAAVLAGPFLPDVVGYTPDVPQYPFDAAAATTALDAAGWRAVSPNEFIALARTQEQQQTPAGQEFVDRSDQERLAELSGQEYFRVKQGQPLTIELTIVDQPENQAVAAAIQTDWQAVGVRTIIRSVSPEQVRREVLKPRAYQALLYSEILGADPDPFPFWHSSQAADPGVNLALWQNRKADKLLEDARTATDPAVRQDKYESFQTILLTELPALFLYRPLYPYWVNRDVRGVRVTSIAVPADRLGDLVTRYLNVKRIWPQ